MATTLASQVQELYVGYLGRAADKAGLDFWVKAIESGTSTLESVALGFTLSEEYKAQYNGLTTTQLVAKVYQNVLGRAADADGLAFWAGEVNKGVIKADTLVKTMIGSLGAIDQLTIDNKVAAANAYTVAAGDKYSVEAGKAAVVNAGSTVPGTSTPGQTFTLTTGTDVLDPNSAVAASKTTSGDDLIRALNSDATKVAGNSLNTADAIDGGAGNDTLNIEITAADAAYTVKPVIKNVETLNLTTLDATKAITLDLGDSTGVTKFVSKAGAAAQKNFTVDKLVLGTAVEVAGDHTGAVATVKFAAATGTADSASVTLNKAVGNGTIVLDGIETINLASTGSSNAVTVNGTTVETINVTGSVATTLTLGAGAAGHDTIKTIDASAATGNFTLGTITTANNDVTIKGSSANNVLDIAGTKKATVTTLGGNDSIKIGNSDVTTLDSGAGNDQITVSAAAKHVITTGTGSDIIAFSGAKTAATSTAAKTVTVKDFTAGSDKLDLRLVQDDKAAASKLALVDQAKLTAIQTAVDALAADKTLTDALTAAANLIGTNDGATTDDAELAFFQFKGDTYVFADQSDAAAYTAGDFVVKLTGTVALTAVDFTLA